MPNTIGVVLPGTLLAQIEVATIAAAGAAYLKNPVAGRAILQAAAIALFEPPIGPLLVAAIATAVAAYCIAQWGATPDSPPVLASTYRIYQAPAGRKLLGDVQRISDGITFYGSAGDGVANILEQMAPGSGNSFPWIRGTNTDNGAISTSSNNETQGVQLINVRVKPITGQSTPAVIVDPLAFPTLTNDETSLIAQVGTCTIPRAIPKKLPDAENPTMVIPPLIGKVGTDVLDCCLETRNYRTLDTAKLDLILARVRRACINIGLPDLDGSNTGNITGQNTEFYYTLSSSIQELLRALGPWPSNATTRFNSTDAVYSSVRRGLDTIKDRLSYDELEDTPTPTNSSQKSGDVQEHIRYTQCEQVDASFYVGYADSAPARNHLKIIFTDKSKYRNRQNAQMHVPNPKANLTDAQIKGAIPVRILGSYWCTLLLADKTKLTGWFPSSTVGQTQLTDVAALTISGVSNPVRFTATLKAYGTPAIAGTNLTPTGYAYNRLNSNGTFTLITRRI